MDNHGSQCATRPGWRPQPGHNHRDTMSNATIQADALRVAPSRPTPSRAHIGVAFAADASFVVRVVFNESPLGKSRPVRQVTRKECAS